MFHKEIEIDRFVPRICTLTGRAPENFDALDLHGFDET